MYSMSNGFRPWPDGAMKYRHACTLDGVRGRERERADTLIISPLTVKTARFEFSFWSS